jgi:hypothetical protein
VSHCGGEGRGGHFCSDREGRVGKEEERLLFCCLLSHRHLEAPQKDVAAGSERPRHEKVVVRPPEVGRSEQVVAPRQLKDGSPGDGDDVAPFLVGGEEEGAGVEGAEGVVDAVGGERGEDGEF